MLLIGIILLVLQGIFWMAEGCVDSIAARRNASITQIFFLTAQIMTVLGGILMPFQAVLPDLRNPAVLAMLGVLLLSGVLVYISNYLLYVGMKRGPNGIIWAFFQSAMLLPFALGILVHGDLVTPCRLTGISMLTLGLLAFGVGNDRKSRAAAAGGKAPGENRKNWVLPTLAATIANGFSQYATTFPSRFPEVLPQLSDVTRSTMVYLAMALACIVHGFFRRDLRKMPTRLELGMGLLVGVLCVIGYYFLIFQGSDLLTACGAGALAFPIPVGVCVVAFTLYSVFKLHERYSPLEWAGMGLCSSGVVVIIL